MTSSHPQVPTLSMADFDGQKGAFSDALGQAWRETGFVGVRDHGVDDAIIDRAYEVFREFFALPAEVKQRYQLPGKGGARGYTGFGVEQAKDHDVPDLKEFWHVGRELADADNPAPEILLPNVWPEEVPGFKEAALALYQALDGLGSRVLSALALDIGLPADWFADKTDFGNSILRPIHYPPIEQAVPGAVRAARHEDINLITLLIGSREQGLEILTRDGDWVPVSTLPGTIVVNVGDMLQRLTNRVYPSTTHRVVNPPGDAARRARYSIPFFLHPNPDFLIRTLPQCVEREGEDHFPGPITSHEYLLERLREIKLI
ncbi:isopenicillin N synthase family dioxygenase [Wenzhouxiangella marina]|uniref:2-oxoglutarate-dependent ethylene/succinate-forming enzyme n=1 Tax=Wenzhouxiangella marina TaxID=1579979 RepID=A0A0K0XWN0_9GAMM|nr:2-oxoglutarate and iron-dependent oxygenase domain-containing protein [Wenzhouxiangella marina]AKS42109.1 Flavonol synthase [Wenzhouxiangella marina]MBB6086120.1 isopenicillin N synthase-like dioxygenase [Wenzhouxiangella marina]